VPLRILALGKSGGERVEADVYLLTDEAPALLPAPTGRNGIRLDFDAAASESLLADLRSDRGMEWIPSSAWLTKVAVDSEAAQLSYDLAIDASGAGAPSAVDAGFTLTGVPVIPNGIDAGRLLLAVLFSLMGVAGIWLMTRHAPRDAVR
jgi:hypothetical protein